MYAAKKPINKQANMNMAKPNNKVFVRPAFDDDGDGVIDALAIRKFFSWFFLRFLIFQKYFFCFY
mgnify:CR=1 FL=1